MKGRLGLLHKRGAKFVFAGLVWYVLVCLQGPFNLCPRRTEGHPPHQLGDRPFCTFAVLGFSGFIGLGAIYFFLPRITGRPLYSEKLATSSTGSFLPASRAF